MKNILVALLFALPLFGQYSTFPRDPHWRTLGVGTTPPGSCVSSRDVYLMSADGKYRYCLSGTFSDPWSPAVNSQTSTSYTILATDGGKRIVQANGSAIADTLPQAGASFPNGWHTQIVNTGAGTVTITPTTSTIDGGASLALTTNQGVEVWSNGTNYFTFRGLAPARLADSGANGVLTRTALNTTAAAKVDDMSAPSFCIAASASGTAYTCALSPVPGSYGTGTLYRFMADVANTGAATVNFNSLGAKSIVKLQGAITTALAANDLRAGQWVILVYDGTNMQMMSQPGN